MFWKCVRGGRDSTGSFLGSRLPSQTEPPNRNIRLAPESDSPGASQSNVMNTTLYSSLFFLLLASQLGCESSPPEPTSLSQANSAAKPSPTGEPPMKVAKVPISPDDPLKGKFTLADATKGLTGN